MDYLRAFLVAILVCLSYIALVMIISGKVFKKRPQEVKRTKSTIAFKKRSNRISQKPNKTSLRRVKNIVG